MIRYTITAIKSDGLRHMAFDNNGRNTYATQQQAEEMLRNVINNNNAEDVAKKVGDDLKVMPVECYDHGDAMGTIFE